jgi:aspartyl-tRNA(Asn)/glutamyl-tRNA(Gln) amidotransferase subunit A
MKPESDSKKEQFRHIASDFVSASTSQMHGIVSRTDPNTVASELDRLNNAVLSQSVARGISPFSQPADFQRYLLEAADNHTVTTKAATPSRLGNLSQRDFDIQDLNTITEAAAALRDGRITCEALTANALALAAKTQPTLNAFIEIWADKALSQAKKCDQELSSGHDRGVLHGIPLAHKDCFEIIGHAATIGSKAHSPQPSLRDAEIIQRLDEAGSVTIGTLNMNEMVAGPTGQNPIFGDCANAIDPTRISGGSSSGSGTSVAAGVVFGSIGSDTGGSIRLPASVNGLFGLKPTYGRVSRNGCFPRAFTLDCPGPLTRTAKDCAILLKAVAGHDAQEPSTLAAPVLDYPALLDSAVQGSRIGILDLPDAYKSHVEIQRAFELFVQKIERSFGKVALLEFPNIDACNAMGDVISKVEAATLHGQWMRKNPSAYSQAVFSRTEPGLHLPAARYLEALLLRSSIFEQFIQGPLKQADIVLCPTLPIPVPTRVDADMEKPGSVFGVVATLTRLTRPFSYLGLPVLSMPIGVDSSGMPVGAQVIGRPLSEARLLSFAHCLSAVD